MIRGWCPTKRGWSRCLPIRDHPRDGNRPYACCGRQPSGHSPANRRPHRPPLTCPACGSSVRSNGSLYRPLHRRATERFGKRPEGLVTDRQLALPAYRWVESASPKGATHPTRGCRQRFPLCVAQTTARTVGRGQPWVGYSGFRCLWPNVGPPALRPRMLSHHPRRCQEDRRAQPSNMPASTLSAQSVIRPCDNQ